ncbi:MAG: hypothetical protein ACKE9I_09240 [Methylophagaceae bacterium]
MVNINVQKTFYIILCIITVLLPLNSIQAEVLTPISGNSIDIESIVPADVLARAKLLSDEVNLIRLELGKPEVLTKAETVIDASPREVYFQAQTAFIKANRLVYERTGQRSTVPSEIDITTIQPFHVWQMVNQAYEQILLVKNKLKINQQEIEKPQPIYTSPSDVFAHVVSVNGQINALLNQQFSPSDVYQKVNESIHIMAALLATEPSVKRIPLASSFERRKTPTDVYQYLIETRVILAKIMANYDIHFAHIQNDNTRTRTRAPSDVYDLASLLVANLHYVHSLKLAVKPPAKTYPSVNKIPSDVYQRLSILHQQLLLFQKLHEHSPNWLNK